MPKKISKPVEPATQVRLPDTVAKRLDVAVGAGATVGGVPLKTPVTSDALPSKISRNPEFAADASAATPTGQASLSSATVTVQADARNLARLGDGFIDAGAQAGHRFGTNASSTSVVVRGDYRRPIVATPFGAVSVYGGARLAAELVSGSVFDSKTGQGADFSGTAAQVAIAGGLDMVVLNRVPVRVGVEYRVSQGDMGHGVSLSGSAMLATLEVGGTVVENSKPAWKTNSQEAGLPQSLTEFEKLENFSLTPDTVKEYNTRLLALAGEVGRNNNLSNDECAKAFAQIEALWNRSAHAKVTAAYPDPNQFLTTQLVPQLLPIAVRDIRLLRQLEGMNTKALGIAKFLSAQENCQAKLDVLNTFYAQIFSSGKGSDKVTQAEFRDRANQLIKDLVDAAAVKDETKPNLLSDVLKAIPKALKGTDLLKDNKAALKEAAKKIADADLQREVISAIDA